MKRIINLLWLSLAHASLVYWCNAQSSNDCTPLMLEQQFNYTISATGTENAIIYPDLPVAWRAEVSATETWSEQRVGTAYASVQAEGSSQGPDVQETYFIPTASGPASLEYSIIKYGTPSSYAAGTINLWRGNTRIFAESKPYSTNGSIEFVAASNTQYRIELIASGSPSAHARVEARASYPVIITVQVTALRTAATGSTSTINTTEGTKPVAAIAIQPQAERGGTLSGFTYTVTDSSDLVQTWVSNSFVFASTSYSETRPISWSGQESGTASITPSDGDKLIVATSLTAPNNDTQWSVSDDNDQAQTWMASNRLLARLNASTHVLRITAFGSVPVSISPIDAQSQGNGTTPMERMFYQGQRVCLSVPARLTNSFFAQWEDSTGNVLSMTPDLQFTVASSNQILAVYRPLPMILGLSRNASEVTLLWSSEPAAAYRVLWALVPLTNEWVVVADVTADAMTTQWKDVSSRASLPQGFYHIEAVR